MKKNTIKLGEVLTVGEFKTRFLKWSMSIAIALIVILIGLSIWQEAKNYAFYGVPAVLIGWLLSLPITLFIVSAKEIELKIEVLKGELVNSNQEIDVIDKEKDTEQEEKDTISKEIDTMVYESMTVAQLRDIAKEKGLTGYSSLKKSDLIELLKK
jgi:hypothetical protein